ncbi:hypothetical protein HYX14_05180 [Candidatus Woesearchaeota archaeon]|nr:hypothetical protein [Candidatus Woesearchaeota archaeon]
MTLVNEAAYIYVYSKKLRSLHGDVIDLQKDARGYHEKFISTKNEKFKQKYDYALKKMKERLQEYHVVLAKINHHQIAFAGQLQKMRV